MPEPAVPRMDLPTPVLSGEEIVDLIRGHSLVVTPILDLNKQIGRASIDVRLGDEFISMRRAAVSALDVKYSREIRERVEQYQHRARVRPFSGEPIILHPGQLIIGATLEYVQLPPDIMAYVAGRSSWGRLGLIVATATFIDPGFRGVVILELVNDGEIPVALYPGIRIAQLAFHKLCRETCGYSGKYGLQTRPLFSKIHEEAELSIFAPKHRKPRYPRAVRG